MVDAFGILLIIFGAICIFYGLMASCGLPDDDLMTF